VVQSAASAQSGEDSNAKRITTTEQVMAEAQHSIQCIDGADFQRDCMMCDAPLEGRPDFMCEECRAEWIRETRWERGRIGLVDPPVQFTPPSRGRGRQ
jgi:hypothetical protein